MRLATYRGSDGAPRSGVVLGGDGQERIIDLAAASGGRIGHGDLLALLEAGPDAVDAAQAIAASGATEQALGSVELLAPMARPPKILAVAGNYQAHIVESGVSPVDKASTVPKLFIKPSSSVIAPNVAVSLPTVSNTLDWELELAVVIGRRCRDLPVDRALDHVAGYMVINDISARAMDWGVTGREPSPRDLWFDWLNGKWGDGFAPIGPWLVTADEIPDPQGLRLRLSVNGTVHQYATTADMVFSCAELISFASRFMTLEPGDVFATGTPDGVGASTGTYLKDGDVMEGWIEGIGTLVTPVTASVGTSRISRHPTLMSDGGETQRWSLAHSDRP